MRKGDRPGTVKDVLKWLQTWQQTKRLQAVKHLRLEETIYYMGRDGWHELESRSQLSRGIFTNSGFSNLQTCVLHALPFQISCANFANRLGCSRVMIRGCT